MADKIFLDSNIWLYLFLKDESDKYEIVEKYILKNSANPLYVSYQVVNEVTNQLIRNGFNETIIRKNIEYLFRICTITQLFKRSNLVGFIFKSRIFIFILG